MITAWLFAGLIQMFVQFIKIEYCPEKYQAFQITFKHWILWIILYTGILCHVKKSSSQNYVLKHGQNFSSKLKLNLSLKSVCINISNRICGAASTSFHVWGGLGGWDCMRGWRASWAVHGFVGGAYKNFEKLLDHKKSYSINQFL